MKYLLYIVYLLNVIHTQVALPSFHAAQKVHTSVIVSGTQTFSYTGSQQTFTIPGGVTSITIKAWGAQGGDGGPTGPSIGGKGGYSTGDLSVNAGETINIYVGGEGVDYVMQGSGGWNGGGDTNATSNDNKRPGTGGGASDVRYNGTSYSNRVIVAGGGGGAGGWQGNGLSHGGAGGGSTGEDGDNKWYNGDGKGGTQSAGGAGGANNTGSPGGLGYGGRGKGTSHGGGGGGGGYYGGGGGRVDAGGGGSGYIGGVSSATTIAGNASMPNPDGGTMTGREGNGLVIISW